MKFWKDVAGLTTPSRNRAVESGRIGTAIVVGTGVAIVVGIEAACGGIVRRLLPQRLLRMWKRRLRKDLPCRRIPVNCRVAAADL